MTRHAPTRRTYTKLATEGVKRELARLLELSSESAYRDAMTQLGRYLGDHLKEQLGRRTFAVVTTPEDADYLTRGVLERVPSERAHLACYWTQRISTSTEHQDVAAVIQEFVEPMPKRISSVIVTKSIISSGCIIRTNLEKFLTRVQPERILIAAPVMLAGADKALAAEFDPSISSRFEFITFATDTKRDEITRNVVPGVGGRVEERLGLKGKSSRFAPELVKERSSLVSLSA